MTCLCATRPPNVFPKPRGWSWEEAATLPVAALTAYRALFTVGRLQPAETVLVLVQRADVERDLRPSGRPERLRCGEHTGKLVLAPHG